jgi:hypothetical protein
MGRWIYTQYNCPYHHTKINDIQIQQQFLNLGKRFEDSVSNLSCIHSVKRWNIK